MPAANAATHFTCVTARLNGKLRVNNHLSDAVARHKVTIKTRIARKKFAFFLHMATKKTGV